jgi:hypothetical protein
VPCPEKVECIINGTLRYGGWIMAEKTRAICIGGIGDGRELEASGKLASYVNHVPHGLLSTKILVDHYRLEQLAVPGGTPLPVWVKEGLGEADILTLLLETYARIAQC